MIEVDAETGAPRCGGCGERLYFLPAMLNSSARGVPFGEGGRKGASPDYAHLGTYAPKVAEFAREHARCRKPQIETTANGIRCIDQRRWR